MQLLSFDRHCFPLEVIRHAICLYARFTESYRDVEELWAERGFDVSTRRSGDGRSSSGRLSPATCRLRPRPADTWHLNETVVSIRGRRM